MAVTPAVPVAVPVVVMPAAVIPTAPATTTISPTTIPTPAVSTPTAAPTPTTISLSPGGCGATTPVSRRLRRPATALIPVAGRSLNQSPQLKRDQEILARGHDLRLDRLVSWNSPEPSACGGEAQRIRGRCGGVHDRIRERAAELKADRSTLDRQTIGVGHLDHQRGRQCFADRGALVVAADDAEGGRCAPSAARQRQVLAAAGERKHCE
jgi:hypothetical protein